MQIRRDTWHYSFFYDPSYDFFGRDPAPKSTNLCQYVRRIVISAIPLAIIIFLTLLITSILGVVQYLVIRLGLLIYWLRGKRSTVKFGLRYLFETSGVFGGEGRLFRRIFASYEVYPPYRIGRWTFYPWEPILVTVLVVALGFGLATSPELTAIAIGSIALLFTAIAPVRWIVVGIRKWAQWWEISHQRRRDEDARAVNHPAPPPAPSILRTWWQAKRERICPRIEFVDPPKEQEQNA